MPFWGSVGTWVPFGQYGYFSYAPSTGQMMDREDSGEDWWYAHCNLYDGSGTHIGYAAAGYNTMPNWKYVDGYFCFDFDDMDTDPHKTIEWEKPGLRKGALQSWLARYDLDGNQLWCRSYLPGAFYGVALDTDGNIVAIGEAHANRKAADLNNGQVVGYDPGLSDPVNLAELDCSMMYEGDMLMGMVTKAYIAKIDLNGQVVWQNLYGWPTDHIAGWKTFSRGFALAPIAVDGGTGFYCVMHGGSGQQSDWNRMWNMRIRSDGSIVDRYMFDPTDALGTALGWTANNLVRGFSVKSVELGGTQHVAIAGQYGVSQGPQAGTLHAFACLIEDIDADPYTVDAVYHTNSASLASDHDPASIQNSNDICFHVDGQDLAIIWPVLSDFVPPTNWYAGRSIATLKVHRFDVGSGPTPTWTADLGEVRAYDLQAGVTSTADGHIAVVSSKWHPPFDLGNPFRYPDLQAHIQDHITTDFSGHDWVNTEDYDYWATSAYVAKLDGATGAPIWEMVVDAEPDKDHQIWPGDIRKQECLYKITEADDGGLVISGNTSHNFDDALLMKFRPDCQAKLAYDLVPDAYGQHMLPNGNTDWTADLTLHGEVIVPNGSTLSINGATIRFADSDQMHWASRIIVEPGGVIYVQNATLTADDRCPNSMWDGVQLHGNYFARQLPQYQGTLRMEFATISHARTGVLAAKGDPRNPLGPIIKNSTGGIVHASQATFLNNRYDAVFHPFENRLASGAVTSNASYFNRCSMMTSGGLPLPGQFPADHVAMVGVRGIPFRGCTWGNSLLGPPMEWPFEQGTGIRAINSSFTVGNHCSVIVPYPNPCPPANTTPSSFTNLHRGILATTFDPSRTFSVDNTTFTGTNFGIRMEGIQDAAITRSTFNVPEPLIPGIFGAVYGVYSDQCTGYTIQENTFTTLQPTGLNRKVGLIIKDSGPQYNTFYNNTFDNLYTGSLIQGRNANVPATIGLEVKCNDYGLADGNAFDVALTGSYVTVQGSQGSVILDPFDQVQWRNPAGNRFSLLHTGSDHPEEDWYVQNSSTFVEYFHHTSTFGNRTRPDHHDLDWLLPNPQGVPWPSERELACPTHLDGGGHEVKRVQAGEEYDAYADGQAAYDATKDDGDTYSLLGYVSDPAHGSVQVRDALQSVAPKVSTEVWQAVFERNPTMNAWHITQALLSNSPLQGEVLKMVDHYALPSSYASMVYSAQSGEVNILSLLRSTMAWHAGAFSEAISGLGHLTWLDSLSLDQQLDSLLLLHQELPSWNSPLAFSGVLAAKGEYGQLETLALQESQTNEVPELYALLKHYAEAQQQGGWHDAEVTDVAWLEQLAAQRDVIGSAHANAWLLGLGYDLPEEIIILPEDGPKSAGQPRDHAAIDWDTGMLLEAFPNPSNGPLFVVYEVPESSPQAELRLLDLHGRTMRSTRLGDGPGMLQWSTQGLAPGIYMAELRVDGMASKQVKVVVQR